MADNGRELMLLSVHPDYVRDILDGRKTVELRRTRPLIEPDQKVLLYASSPVCAVLGSCRISAFEVGTAESIKTKHLDDAAISSPAYDDYFRGSTRAVALFLSHVVTLTDPVRLSSLRVSPATRPVQSWRFMSTRSLEPLLGAADRDALGYRPPGPLRTGAASTLARVRHSSR